MPGYERAPVSAELKVVLSDRAEKPPQGQIKAAKKAAGASGLAREAGPETVMLAGSREEVLQAMMKVVDAALVAGAEAVEVKVEAEADADRFGEAD
ncbi:hypothetical protein BH24ACT21_BH24ACT21_01920 [soil metagenome]|jgi:uncharacterized protein YqgV (UPF0045/DUF77 family)